MTLALGLIFIFVIAPIVFLWLIFRGRPSEAHCGKCQNHYPCACEDK